MRYLNIKIQGESNEIGVISLPELHNNSEKRITQIKEVVEPKLVEALKSHFDCPVKTILVEVNEELSPIMVTAHVIIESDDQDHQEEVSLEETWVY